MKRSTELILGELTKHLGEKHLISELVEIANDLTEILERNNELERVNKRSEIKGKAAYWREKYQGEKYNRLKSEKERDELREFVRENTLPDQHLSYFFTSAAKQFLGPKLEYNDTEKAN